MKGLHAEQSELIIKKEYTIAKQILGDLESVKIFISRRRSIICDDAFIKYCCYNENRYENIEELLGKIYMHLCNIFF